MRLDRAPGKRRAATVAASNSVVGPPASLAVTPDGRYAIVVEAVGPRPAGADPKLSDLPVGRTLTVVDLSDPDRPRIVQQMQSFERPFSVSVSADGTLVAIAYQPAKPAKGVISLALHRFSAGRLSAPITPAIPGWSETDSLAVAEFHPKENVLALLSKKSSLRFVRVQGTGTDLRLTPWGNTVAIEGSPWLVRFTPDGRYALVNCSYEGADVSGPVGTVSSFRLDARRAADGSPEHLLASRANAGLTPEGLGISPDGRWVATANLDLSYLPLGDARQSFAASLTLLRLDPQSGALERVGEFPFDGILPETVLFDNSSRIIAATSFDRFDGQNPGGSLGFWRIDPDRSDSRRAQLVKMNESIPVTRGAHSMVIVR